MMEKVNEVKAEQVVMYLACKYGGWTFKNLDPAAFWRMYEVAHVPFNMKPIAYLNDESDPLRFPLPVRRGEVVESIFYDEILPGLKALGCSVEDPSKIVEELKEAVEKLPPEARIVRTIRNRLRTIIGDVVERLNWGKIGEKAGRQYWVRITWALEAFLKLGSHSFDSGSCFRSSGSNWYHRYTLAMSSGSFVGYVLRQSENCEEEGEQKFSRIGRFWGFVDRDTQSVVFSNFYGVNALQDDERVLYVAQKLADYLGLGFRPEHVVVASVFIGVYKNGDHIVVSADKNTAYVESLWTCPHCGEERSDYLLEHSCFEDDEQEIYCERCSRSLEEDEIIWMGDCPYCSDCAGYCDYCGEPELRGRMYRVGDEEWCDYCYVNHAARCEVCDFAVDMDYAEDYMHVVKLYLVCSLGRFYYNEPEEVYICENCYRELSSCSRCNRKSLELVLLTSLSDAIEGRLPEEKICVECYFELGFDRQHGSTFRNVRTGDVDPYSKSKFFVPVNYSGGNE